MIQIVKKWCKVKAFFESGGGNICFFRYAFLVLGVSFVGNATSCLYSLTFSDSIQAQNLCKSLAGVRWFKVCRACMRKFCTKDKIPHPA